MDISVSPSTNVEYGTGTTVRCNASTAQLTLNIYEDGTLVQTGTGSVVTYTATKDAGNYSYVCNTTGNQNYTNSSSSEAMLTVNKANPTMTLTLNGVDGNVNVAVNQNVVSSGTISAPAGGTLDLYLDTVLVNSAVGVVSDTHSWTTDGTHTVKLEFGGNTNYNPSTITHQIRVGNPGGSGGGKSSNKKLDVEYEIKCPDSEVGFKITSSNKGVEGVRTVLKDSNNNLEVKYTNSKGYVWFDIEKSGSYILVASKSGYTHISNGYELDICQINNEENISEQPECTSNNDCSDSEYCESGECKNIQTGECGYIENHEWIDYSCCADEDCSEGEVCQNHECVLPQQQNNFTLETEPTGFVGDSHKVLVLRNGNPLPNTTVEITMPDGNSFEGTTDENGVLHFVLDSEGEYKITLPTGEGGSTNALVLSTDNIKKQKCFKKLIILLNIMLH